MAELAPQISAPPRDTVPDSDPPAPRIDEAARTPLTRFGRFVIIDAIGEGGMGTVYRAYDPDLDRRVAVKVLHRHDQDERGTAMLLREAKTMAQLNHPNVITVHEVDTHEGHAFVAMEYVDGGTLRDWCNTHGPGEPGRGIALVELLRQATAGLAAAHAAGLVHRDVKPANMLIDRGGRLRVADFGLAGSFGTGASSPDDADEDTGNNGRVCGTPAYMAPEQFLGQADARSDQFGLCSAFYEAFFGTRPFSATSLAQRLMSISEARIERPAPGHTAPRFVRELLVRGLHQDPTARWASLDEMLAAIARGTSRPRRGLVLGLTGGVAIAAAALFLFDRSVDPCVDGASTFAHAWDDARRENVRDAFLALDASFAHEAASPLVVELDDYATHWIAGWRDACEATRVHRTQTDELMTSRIRCLDDHKRHFESLVAVLAAADTTVASNAFRSIAELPRVQNCADPDFVKAQLPPPDDPELAAEVDSVLTDLARVDASIAAGKYEDALAIATATADRAMRLEHPPIRARTMVRLARARFARGELDGAYEAGLSAFEVVSDADASASADIASMLGIIYEELGRYDDALAHYRRARAIDVRVLGERDISVGTLDVRIAKVLDFLGSYDESLALHRRAVDILEEGLGERHPLVGVALTGLAHTLLIRGRSEDADAVVRDALAMQEEALGPAHPELAITLDVLGNVGRTRGKYEDALAIFERARGIRVASLGAEHPEIYRSEANIAGAYIDLGRPEEAVAAYQRALALLRRTHADEDLVFAPVRGSLGLAYMRSGNRDAALTEYFGALTLYERHGVEDSPDTAILLTNIGGVLENQGRYDEALSHLQRALAIRVKELGDDNSELASTHATIGYVLAALGRTEDALHHHGRALALDERALGSTHPYVAGDHNALGFVLGPAGEYERALAEHREALAIYDAHPANANAMWAHVGIGYALADLEEWAEAADAFAAASAIAVATKGDAHKDTAVAVAGTALCAAALARERAAADARAHLERIAHASTDEVTDALARLLAAMAEPRTTKSEATVQEARAELERRGQRGFLPVVDRWLASRG